MCDEDLNFFLSPTSPLGLTLTHTRLLLSNCKIKQQALKSEREREKHRGEQDFTSTAILSCLFGYVHDPTTAFSAHLWICEHLWLLVLHQLSNQHWLGGREQQFPRLPVWLTSSLLQRSARQCITDAPASPRRLWRNRGERWDREKTQEQEEC